MKLLIILFFIFLVIYFDNKILKIFTFLVGLYSVGVTSHVEYAMRIQNVAKQEDTASRIVKYLHNKSEAGAYIKALNSIAGCDLSLRYDGVNMSDSDLLGLQRKMRIFYNISLKCPVLGETKSQRETFYVINNELYAYVDNKKIYLFDL